MSACACIRTHTGKNFSAKKSSHFICISVCVCMCVLRWLVRAIFWQTLMKCKRFNAIKNAIPFEMRKMENSVCASDIKLNCTKNQFSSSPPPGFVVQLLILWLGSNFYMKLVVVHSGVYNCAVQCNSKFRMSSMGGGIQLIIYDIIQMYRRWQMTLQDTEKDA